MSNYLKIDQYKIASQVHPMFDDYPCNLVDFKRHLKPNIILNKVVTRSERFRPVTAEYYFNDVKVAERKWTFTDGPDQMMRYRKVEMAYVLNDSQMGDYWTLEENTYSFENSDDVVKITKERSDARKHNIAEMKGILLVTLMLQHPNETQETIEEWGADFFEDYAGVISAYAEAGNARFIDKLQSDVTHLWLNNVMVPDPPTTIRTWMISRIV